MLDDRKAFSQRAEDGLAQIDIPPKTVKFTH
jgi:hypothetical protein